MPIHEVFSAQILYVQVDKLHPLQPLTCSLPLCAILKPLNPVLYFFCFSYFHLSQNIAR